MGSRERATDAARTQRRARPLLALVVLATIIAGCGGGAASPAATSAPATTAASTPAAAPAATPAAPATTAPATGTAPVTAQANTTRTAPTTTTAARPAATAAATGFPLQGPHIGYGMNVWLPAGDADRTLGLLSEAGFGWARQWIAWDSVEPQQGVYNWTVLDQVTAAAERRGVKLLVVFPRAPTWAAPNNGIPQDKRTYGNFLAAVARRYGNKIAGFEVWNEPNLAAAVGGTVNVAEYVELLKAAFTSVKAVSPSTYVLYGGLTPTGINDPAIAIDDVIFLQQSYAYNGGEIRRYFDVLGAHANATNNPPDTLWPENPGPGPGFFESRSFYFRRVEDLRGVMESAGDAGKQIWVTEFGWTTRNLARGYEYGQYVSEQDQANYLVDAYTIARERWPWAGVMFLWNLNFSTITPPEDEKHPWSIINADYSPRPAYDALRRMPKP